MGDKMRIFFDDMRTPAEPTARRHGAHARASAGEAEMTKAAIARHSLRFRGPGEEVRGRLSQLASQL